MKLHLGLFLSFFFLFSSLGCSSPVSRPQSGPPFKAPTPLLEKLEALRVQHHVPGASISFIQDGEIFAPVSLGFANLEQEIDVTPNTLFQACSITKTLTSALVLKEFEKRGLSLEQPANDFLKRWKIPPHTSGKQATVRMLLNHTAGLSDPYPDGGAKIGKQKATLLEHFKGTSPAVNPPLTLVEEPGKKYKYCNGCYAVLQMVIEDLTGKDYRDLIRTEFLKPVGMKTSSFNETLLDGFHPNVALNYDDQHRPHPPQRKLPIYSTGALWTTSAELIRLVQEVQKALTGKSSVLSARVAHDLVRPDFTPDRGLGFFLGDRFGGNVARGSYFNHGGQNVGYLAILLGSLDGRFGAVILINISSPWGAKDFPHFKFIKDAVRLIGDFYSWN